MKRKLRLFRSNASLSLSLSLSLKVRHEETTYGKQVSLAGEPKDKKDDSFGWNTICFDNLIENIKKLSSL